MPKHQRERTVADLARDRGPALTSYAYLLTGDVAAAQDRVQDAFVKVFVRSRSGLGQGVAEASVADRRSQIAEQMRVSAGSIKWYRRNALHKLETVLGPVEAPTDDLAVPVPSQPPAPPPGGQRCPSARARAPRDRAHSLSPTGPGSPSTAAARR